MVGMSAHLHATGNLREGLMSEDEDNSGRISLSDFGFNLRSAADASRRLAAQLERPHPFMREAMENLDRYRGTPIRPSSIIPLSVARMEAVEGMQYMGYPVTVERRIDRMSWQLIVEDPDRSQVVFQTEIEEYEIQRLDDRVNTRDPAHVMRHFLGEHETEMREAITRHRNSQPHSQAVRVEVHANDEEIRQAISDIEREMARRIGEQTRIQIEQAMLDGGGSRMVASDLAALEVRTMAMLDERMTATVTPVRPLPGDREVLDIAEEIEEVRIHNRRTIEI